MSSLSGDGCVKWEGLQDTKKKQSAVRTLIIEMGKNKTGRKRIISTHVHTGTRI